MDPDRARAELPTVPDEVVAPGSAPRPGRSRSGPRRRAGSPVNGWWLNVQRLLVLVPLEEREVGHPEELVAALVDQLELAAEVVAHGAEHARDRQPARRRRRARSARARRAGPPRSARARRGTSRSASAPRPPRRTRGTRGPCRPTPSPAPPARRARRARAAAARRGTGRSAPARRPRSRSRGSPRSASCISSPKRRSGLSEPKRAIASCQVMPPERALGRRRGPAPRTTRRPRPRARRRPPRASGTPSRGRAGGTRTAGRRADPRPGSSVAIW